jgi:hypothetical protein
MSSRGITSGWHTNIHRQVLHFTTEQPYRAGRVGLPQLAILPLLHVSMSRACNVLISSLATDNVHSELSDGTVSKLF